MTFEIKPDRLKKIVTHAYTTTSFYMNQVDEYLTSKEIIEWYDLPLTKKGDVVLHADTFISSPYLPLYLQRKLLRTHTSGSTGKCIDVYWSVSEFNYSLFPLWLRRKKFYQINPHDRRCYFFTSLEMGATDKESENVSYGLGFCKSNLNEEKLMQIWNKIRDYNPCWIISQPSMLSLICAVVENNHLNLIPNLRYIESSGEMLVSSIKKWIEETLRVKVVNQYGCNEMNSIAYECPDGHLHCMDRNVYTEILDEKGKPIPKGEEGEIYITTLTNYAMPLIRYQVGDRGRFVNQKCKYSLDEKIIELTNGRNNDWVIDNKGERLNTYIFVRCVENINLVYENAIRQFQVIQHQIGNFTVHLVIDDEYEQSQIWELFIGNLWQTSLSGSGFKVVFHSHLLLDDSSGKLKWFINEI